MLEIKGNPRVSVIIPTHNRAEHLHRAIDSVLAQVFRDFELIIADDGSTDNTPDIIKEYPDERINYIRFDKASGGSLFPRNFALKTARGRYIAMLDDDDYWIDENKLNNQVNFLEDNPEYVMIGTNTVIINEENKIIKHVYLPENNHEIRNQLLRNNCFRHSTVLFRKDAALTMGGYSLFMGTPYSDDHDMWLKLGKVGKLANLGYFAVAYDNKSSTFVSSINNVHLYIGIIKTINRYKSDYPNYLRAISFLYNKVIESLLYSASEITPFVQMKKLLKERYPSFWKMITFQRSNTIQ